MGTATDTRYGKWTRPSDLYEDRVARIHAEMEAEIAAQRLREIREDQHRTQVGVAHDMGVTQKRISEIESADLLRTEYGTWPATSTLSAVASSSWRTSAITPSPSAERTGLAAVSRLETGGSTPTLGALDRLAAALDADLVVALAPKAELAGAGQRSARGVPTGLRLALMQQSLGAPGGSGGLS